MKEFDVIMWSTINSSDHFDSGYLHQKIRKLAETLPLETARMVAIKERLLVTGYHVKIEYSDTETARVI